MTTVDSLHNAGDGQNEHVTDELHRLLLGEAERDTVRRVGAHLRTCTDCRDDLVDAVLAHATLRSAARTSRDVATGGRLAYLGAPSAPADIPALMDDVVARTPPQQLVDLGPVFAQIRAEASSPAATPAPAPAAATDELAARRGRRTRRLLAAAAAVVVIGGGTGIAVTTLSDRGRAVTVSAYDVGTVDASARVGDGWVKLDASGLAPLTSDKYYEAWLVNPGGTGVLALGPLGGDGRATFSVPAPIMTQYPTLQVTVQDNNGDPRPSQTSVLKATL